MDILLNLLKYIERYQIISDLLVYANIILGLLGFTAALKDFLIIRKRYAYNWAWLKLLISIVCLYWACIYTIVLITPLGYFDPVLFGQAFFRAPLTVTIGIMAAGAYWSRKSRS